MGNRATEHVTQAAGIILLLVQGLLIEANAQIYREIHLAPSRIRNDKTSFLGLLRR